MSKEKRIKKILFVLIPIILIIGAIVIGVYCYKIKTTQKQTTIPNIVNEKESQIDTTNWQTYQNAQYNISLKYPSGWRVIDFQTELGMGTWDTFGFIPLTVKNQYCNIEQDVNDSIQNYKTNNPFSDYKKYVDNYDRVTLCSIQVRVEKNPNNLSISDYLKKNYLPIVGNLPKDEVMKAMEEKINSLVVTKNNGLEESQSNYSFHKFVGGSGEFAGSDYLATSVEDKSQVIINTGGNIIFITNHINATKIVDQNQVNNLFKEITNSFYESASTEKNPDLNEVKRNSISLDGWKTYDTVEHGWKEGLDVTIKYPPDWHTNVGAGGTFVNSWLGDFNLGETMPTEYCEVIFGYDGSKSEKGLSVKLENTYIDNAKKENCKATLEAMKGTLVSKITPVAYYTE